MGTVFCTKFVITEMLVSSVIFKTIMVAFHRAIKVKFGIRVQNWDPLPLAKFGKNCLRGCPPLG